MIEPEGGLADTVNEIASEVLDAFSELHPHVRLNRQEWSDLREMIQREVTGHFGEMPDGKPVEMGARDLLTRAGPP